MAGYVNNKGEVVYPKHMIVDDLTFVEGMSRQRKWQLRKRRQGSCIICGIPVETKVRIKGGGFYEYKSERCPSCTAKVTANKRGELQGRPERDYEVEFDAEGFVD